LYTYKGGATNLKVVGGQYIGRWGGGVNTIETLKFEKDGRGINSLKTLKN